MAGIYQSVSDSPEQLKIEAEMMSVKVQYGVPQTGQATVSWALPTPASGCAPGASGSYCGAVVVLSRSPITPNEYPTDGTYYHDDPTADADKHLGDKIGNGLVVGSFWERESKSKGSDDMTKSFVISDIDSGTPYFLALFAMDCSLNYHTDGIRAYSDKIGNNHLDDSGTPAFQNIALGEQMMGVNPTDGTGLIPGKIYQFDIVYDADFPTGKNYITHTVKIDGLNAGTYEDLLEEINKSLLLMGNPAILPTPPKTGHLYWDEANKKLYEYNGFDYDQIKNTIFIEDTDPSIIEDGQHWYNPGNGELNRWDSVNYSPGEWVSVEYMNGSSNPSNLQCDEYWFDGYTVYMWNGSSWIELPTISSSECPSAEYKPKCGSYWYDSENEVLFQWDSIRVGWKETAAVYWHSPPNEPKNGDYWMRDSDFHLHEWNDNQWNDIMSEKEVYVQDIKPLTPDNNALWFRRSTEDLLKWNSIKGEWNEVAVIVWPDNPSDVTSNDLWWNSANDYLYQWDLIENNWVAVEEFVESDVDPRSGLNFEIDTVWFDPEQKSYYRWDGETWIAINAFQWPYPPTKAEAGDVFHDAKNDKWYLFISSEWQEFDPFDSLVPPDIIPNGWYWMDTTTNQLYIRNGTKWLPVEYQTDRYTHKLNSEWYNTKDGKLYTWNGTKWVETPGLVEAVFADFMEDGCKKAGGIQLKTRKTGTGTLAFIPCAGNSKAAGAGCMKCQATGYADFNNTAVSSPGPYCSYYSNYGASCGYPAREIHDQDFLWSNLTPTPSILQPFEGEDAVHNTHSYDVIGVGTDGTPDERRELIDSIRRQLGYPSITVELTHYQIDTAVQGALESYRKRVGASLKRGFFFLDIKPGQQRYLMTNRRIGYDRIVHITDTYRFSSAFTTQAHAAGQYGQSVLQHLYNMGTYDLLSYDLVGQYINQLEISFATRLQYSWNEETRALDFHQSFTRPERVLLDVAVERLEQEIMKDRYAKSWIERYAYSEACLTLAQVRGKFGTLPGAGGGVTLNADQLYSLADSNRQELMQQIDDFVVERPEEWGMGSSFVFG